jgi:hypothetical protein
MKKKRVETLWAIISFIGFLYVLGVAGGLDLNTLTLGQAVVHGIIGLSIMAGAAYMGGFMDETQGSEEATPGSHQQGQGEELRAVCR